MIWFGKKYSSWAKNAARQVQIEDDIKLSKYPFPKPYRPVSTDPSYFYSAAFEQSPCLQYEVEDEFLDEIF